MSNDCPNSPPLYTHPGIEYGRDQTSLAAGNEVKIVRASDGFGWTGIYAAVTDERPHEALHRAIPDVWFASALTTVDLRRTTGDRNEQAVMPTGLVSITAPGESVHDEIGAPLSALHVFLKAEVLMEVADELFPKHRTSRAIVSAFAAADPTLKYLLHAIKASLEEPPGSNALKLGYLERVLAAHVLQKHSTDGGSPLAWKPPESLNSKQLRLVFAYIEENLGSGISISDLASVACVSRVQFIRRFKASTRMTPHQYVMGARVRKARTLLAERILALADIAVICGFSSQAHFTTVFKRFTSMSPAAYRRAVM